MQVRIFQPARNAMQSGRGRTKSWVLEYEPQTPRRPEPLMGWVSSGDTLNQVRMTFATKEDAIAYAERHGLKYDVADPHERKVKPRNYADNFRYVPPGR
ncbi:MAG TPA: ETC complex I subunit [Alphaproteobacteria bacterium]|nr:ETC complex I subunit [Alphaproteobacteria bacterium]